MNGLLWQPAGPVAAAYEASEALNPLIIGPVGSGKTTASVRKIALLANRCPAQDDTLQGVGVLVKRCRVAIVAIDYRILWKNVLPSYWKVFPKDWGSWVGGNNEPAVHRFKVSSGAVADGRRVILDIQVDFMGVGDKDLDEIVRGLELTGCYVYEWDTLPPETIPKFASRLGRYPNMGSGEAQDLVPRQIWGDCNAFDVDHWAYAQCFEVEKPSGREVFVQPGGRSARAENIQFVGRRYYDGLLQLLKPWQVERLVDMRFIADREGASVYPDFSPDHHLVERAAFENTLPLLIGVDGGLDAAAAICQRVGRKRWRVLDECVTADGDAVVAKQFGERLADHLAQNYPGAPAIAFVDPSTENRNAIDVRAWIAQFSEGFGSPVVPAVSNTLRGRDGRIAAVRDVLVSYEHGVFGLVVGPRARTIRRGFAGGYRWEVKHGKRTGRIEKSHASHVHDALQYVIQSVEHQPSLAAQAKPNGRWAPQQDAAPMTVLF